MRGCLGQESGHAARLLESMEEIFMTDAMLVWINGPFGGGKTITACELHRRLPGSVICDPEHVAFGMRRMARLEPDLHALVGEQFAVHVKTDHLTVAQVAETIAAAAGLPISAATDGPLRAAVRQYATTIRHIRFD